MFDKAIVRTDKFLDMPATARDLYYNLGMEVDDEGFVGPRMVMKTLGSSEDDLKLLAAKGYIIPFETGVIVITDFNQNNYLDSNRIKPTRFKEEKAQLTLTNERSYVFNRCLTGVKPGEGRGEEGRREEERTKQVSPSLAREIPNQENTNTQKIIDYFSSRVAEEYGYKPEITGGRDYQLVRRVLKKYSIEDVQSMIDDFLARTDNTGGAKVGASLSYALSGVSINKWLAENRMLQ